MTTEQAARLEAARGNAERLVALASEGDPIARALAIYALNIVERLEQPETLEQERMM